MANLKSIKKGDKVILRMFTGAFVEAKVVEMADTKKIGFTNKAGVKMVFDKETGKQIAPEPKQPKFANYLDDYDEKIEAAELAKKSNKSKKSEKATKSEKASKPEKKSDSKKPTKKSKPAPEPEEDDLDEDGDVDDDDEFEEVDD